MEKSPMKLLEQLKSLINSPEPAPPSSAPAPTQSPSGSAMPSQLLTAPPPAPQPATLITLSPPLLPDPAVALAYEQMVPGSAGKLLRLYERQIWMNFMLAFSSGISNFIAQMTGKFVTALLLLVIIASGAGFLIFGIKSAAVASVISLIVAVCRSLLGK